MKIKIRNWFSSSCEGRQILVYETLNDNEEEGITKNLIRNRKKQQHSCITTDAWVSIKKQQKNLTLSLVLKNKRKRSDVEISIKILLFKVYAKDIHTHNGFKMLHVES